MTSSVYHLQGRYKEAEQLCIELLDRQDLDDRTAVNYAGARGGCV